MGNGDRNRRGKELWIVMELCAAKSLQSVMKAFGRGLSDAELACALRQTARALAYVHAQRRIHRDLKSGNLLLQADGRVKLCDFGVAGELTGDAKRHTMIGSPYWMAPEVIDDAGHDQSADIWSLGITAIELAETVPPRFRENPMRVVFLIPSSPPPTLAHPDRHSPALADFLRCCLAKDPAARHTAAQLLAHPFLAHAEPCPNSGTGAPGSTSTTPRCVLADLAQLSVRTTNAMDTAATPTVAHRVPSPDAAAAADGTFALGSLTLGSLSLSLGTVSERDLRAPGAGEPCARCDELREKVAALERQAAELRERNAELADERAHLKSRLELLKPLLMGLAPPQQ